MSFLFPFTLFLGLLAPVIALFYLHRPRRRSEVVSSLRFWQVVLKREPHRRFFGRLRNPLSLLLQLLIFFLLLLALARPEWGRVSGGQSTLVVVDARARMQAGDTFRLARNAALEVIAQAGPDHEIALLANDGAPRILSPFSTDPRGLREALDVLAPSDAGGGMPETLTLAQRLLAGRPGTARIVVITDRPLPTTEGSQKLKMVLVGTPQDNVAILALAHRPLPASPQSEEVFATLGNFSSEDRNVELELALDDRVFDLKKITLPAGEERNFTTLLPGEMLGGAEAGKLTARLTAPNALAADDTARAALPTERSLRVLLLSDGNPFLENALKADPGLQVEILDPAAWRPEMATGFQAVIFDNWWPEGTTAENYTRGNFFFFGQSPWAVPGDDPAASPVKVSDPESPLLWHVDVSGFQLRTIHPLQPPAGWRLTTPLETPTGPALMTLERSGQARVVVAAFGVNSSTFPLRVGFPIFVSNVVHWLAGHSQEPVTSRTAGRVFVPAAGEQFSIKPWGTTASPAPESSFSKTPRRLTQNGFYEVPSPDLESSSRWIAVNTVDRDESDLRGAEANRKTFLLRQIGISLRPWQWLALAALALIVAEGLFHHRRLTE